MVAGILRRRAENATPWAWLPVAPVNLGLHLEVAARRARRRTSTAGHDAPPPVLGVQMRHLVVRAAQLEAEDGLQVLALEHHVAFQPVAEVDGRCERRLSDHFVDARGENKAEVLDNCQAHARDCYTMQRCLTSG
jgi:hypothetical protein